MTDSNGTCFPTRYRITLTPDLTDFTFSGSVTVTLSAPSPTRHISLNVLDITVQHCRYVTGGQAVDCGFSIDPKNETLRIDLPESVTGDIQIDIDYLGEINNAMAGFYRSRYTHQGETTTIAVTQFQESDARRAFPCMDNPVFKAEFELSIITDVDLTAISNMPARAETVLEHGKKRVDFETTPKMSTYLLFFGVGPFSYLTDTVDSRVRAVVLPGMAESAGYGLEFTRKALHFCEEYYGIPFPLPKLDVIAVPDFAFGAMENWGAITFRENLLLYDPELTAVDGEERICEVIAHEMAHQWFGDLVTPSDWKYLWLNESFATYFGYKVVDHYHENWRIWDEFLESQTETALLRDALTDTISIEIPGGSHTIINSSTAPIIYSKGGSVLRQIEGYIGADDFKTGLNRYLNSHAYDCATSPDLWEALEAVSGKPISNMMNHWVYQTGHPLVTVSRTGDTLHLDQRRFSFLPMEDAGTTWPIPLAIRLFDVSGDEQVVTRMFETPHIAIDLPPKTIAYKVNDEKTGFYRVCYNDPENMGRLKELIRDRRLSAADRWGMVSDQFSLLRAGLVSPAAFLDLVSAFENEDAPLPLSGLIAYLYDLMLVLDGPVKTAVMEAEARLVARALDRMGYTPIPDEPHAASKLRNELLWHAAVLDLPAPAKWLEAEFSGLMAGKSLHPDILRGVMQAGAYLLGAPAYDWLIQRIETSASEHDRMNGVRALGCFRQPDLIEKAQAYIIDTVPDRNKFIPVVVMARNPHAVPLMWDWFVNRIESLEAVHPIIFERIIAAVTPICGLDKGDAVDTFLESVGQRRESAAAVIRLSLEKRDINRRLRAASAG